VIQEIPEKLRMELADLNSDALYA